MERSHWSVDEIMNPVPSHSELGSSSFGSPPTEEKVGRQTVATQCQCEPSGPRAALALLVLIPNGAAPWPDQREQVELRHKAKPWSQSSLRDLWGCLQRDRENACWWEKEAPPWGEDAPPCWVMWRIWVTCTCCPALLRGLICNTCQPHPFTLARQPRQHPSVAKHTSERGWKRRQVREA